MTYIILAAEKASLKELHKTDLKLQKRLRGMDNASGRIRISLPQLMS